MVERWTGLFRAGRFSVRQGPFRVGANGNLTMNPHAWNKLANMVFIEQPAGVGFSTNSKLKGFAYGDEQAAADNWEFVKGLRSAFHSTERAPSTSQVRAIADYMPTLARQIVRNNKGEVNFRGFAGNPHVHAGPKLASTARTLGTTCCRSPNSLSGTRRSATTRTVRRQYPR